MFVPWGILCKIHVVKVRREDIDAHTKDRKIRKQISPSTDAFSEKPSLDEKLSNIEKTHQPDTSFVCLLNKTKSNSIPIHIHIYIYMCVCVCVCVVYLVSKSLSKHVIFKTSDCFLF